MSYRPITAGTTLRRALVDGFVLTEAVQPAYVSLPPHAHARASVAFVLVLGGSFTESGYCDQSHLTHALVAHTGLTPAAYRAAARSTSHD